MAESPPHPQAPSAGSDLEWREDGAPRSRRFGDIYFQPDDGLAESRAVFLAGAGLPEAWRGRRRFVVGELGFGAGLNIAALLHLWRRTAEPKARLHVFSVEAYPMASEEAGRALSAFPDVGEEASALVARWPGRTSGFHRVDLPEWRAVLDVAVMDVEAALTAWTGRADAWFLDGFSPAANPAMWSEAVVAKVAARSAPGAAAATFTVAGAVRRSLSAAGFTVAKAPGFGRKRERLEARLPGAVSEPADPTVAIIGAGIAGASLAWAFRDLGVTPTVVKAGLGASHNPAALVTPRLEAGEGPAARLHALAHARAVRLYRQMGALAVIDEGVLQLEGRPRDAVRFDKVAASAVFPPGAVERIGAGESARRLGEAVESGGLWLRDALTVEPAAVTAALLAETPVVEAEVAAIARDGEALRLMAADGREILRAEIVVVAAGAGTRALTGLALRPIRGQVSHAAGFPAPGAAAWGGYVARARDGLVFGATHDRDDEGAEIRAEDHARNLEILRQRLPRLAARIDPAGLLGTAGVRAAARDHLPVAGALGAGVFVLGGLGGRGFTLAPLLAEHVAAMALGAPSPLPADIARAVNPERPAVEPAGPVQR